MHKGSSAKRDHRPHGSVELQALLLSSLYHAQLLAAYAVHEGHEPVFHESVQSVGGTAISFQSIILSPRRR